MSGVRNSGIAVFAALVAIIGVLLSPTSPRIAFACSAGPDFNPADGAELIVAGYVTDVEILGRAGAMLYLDLAITFEVDEYLFGDGSSTLRVYDSASGVPPPHLVPNSAAFAALDLDSLDVDELEYDGGGGACGALDEDPRGRYWVAGLTRNPDDGRLRMHRLSTFAVGSGPSDPVVVAGLARARSSMVEAGLIPTPAASGNRGVRSEGAGTASTVAAVSSLIALALLGGGRTLSGGSRRPRRG